MRKIIRVVTFLMTIVLTAKLGTVQFNGHKETFYNLNMKKVIKRTDKDFGMTDLYHVREDGVKMYGPWVICASDWVTYPHYSLVETSLGTAIVLDKHTTDSNVIDLAVTW